MDKLRKNFKFAVIILAILIVFLTIYLFVFKKSESPKIKQPTSEEIYADFNKINKSSKLLFYTEESEEYSSIYNQVYLAWEKLSPILATEQCDIFKKSRKLEKSIYIISKSFDKSNETSLEKNFSEANSFFWEANNELNSLKESNGVLIVDEMFLSVYKAAKEVKESATKEDAEDSLEQLKMGFTDLKQYSFDAEYNKILSEMESEIIKMDKFLYGPEYLKAKEDVFQMALDLYNKY